MFSAKLLPLVLFSLRKNVQVGRCWMWAAEDFAASHLPGRMRSDGSNSACTPGLLEELSVALCQRCESTQIPVFWQAHRSSHWSLCGAKLPKERSETKWKFCSIWTWEVSTHCFYFFGALQSMDRESERDSGLLQSEIKSFCSLESQASRVMFIEC